MSLPDWTLVAYVWITSISRRTAMLVLAGTAVATIVLLVGIGLWNSPPSSKSFVPGWTRTEYQHRFGNPIRVLTIHGKFPLARVDTDRIKANIETSGSPFGPGPTTRDDHSEASVEPTVVWQYKTSDGWVYVTFPGDAEKADNVFPVPEWAEFMFGDGSKK